MEGKLFSLTVVVIFMIQTSFCAITVVTPDIVEQNQDPYAGQNFFDGHNIDFTDEKPVNSIDERNSFPSSWLSPSLHPHGSFSSAEEHESSSSKYDNGGLYDQNVEYAPRSINNNYRRSNKHKGCNRNNRRTRRRMGGNGHGNRGRGHHDVGGRHLEGGSPKTGEATHGISAQAAVIGPGATISGVAVTVDHY